MMATTIYPTIEPATVVDSRAAGDTRTNNDENRHGSLLERAHTDPAAMRELVTMFRPMVEAVVRRRCRPSDVEDVVQDVWLALWENRGRIHSPACLPGWLRRVAVNAAIASDRKNRALPFADLPEPRQGDLEIDPTSRPSLVAATRQAVRVALDRLKESDRLLLELLMVDDRPDYVEVSQKTEMPLGSIGPTRQRALRRLQRESNLARLSH